MGTCGPTEFINGGVLKQPEVINPNITGGGATNLGLVNAALTGGVTADDAVLDDLAAGLASRLDVRVYKDCHNSEIGDGDNIATCGDLGQRVSEAVQDLEIKIAAGDLALSTKLDCDVAALGERITNATDPERIAGVFQRSDGTQMGAGAKLVTLDELLATINAAVTDAAGQFDAGAEVVSLTWNAASNMLTLVESKGGAFLPPKSVVIGGLMPAPNPSASPPSAYTVDDGLPLAMYGSRNVILGAPASYLRMNMNGEDGWIPFYRL